LIYHAAHDAAQRVDLAYQVPFSDASYRRVARHLPNQIQVKSYQACVCTQPSGRRSRFTTSMPGTHYNYVK
jgi:hypothetical protein